MNCDYECQKLSIGVCQYLHTIVNNNKTRKIELIITDLDYYQLKKSIE